MANASLTTANSVLMLSIADLFDTAIQLQGYTADDIFSVDAASPIETIMGLDSLLSAGYIPVERRMSITLQGNSPSSFIFEDWMAAQQQALDAFVASMLVTLPAISRRYTCIKGFLNTYDSMPAGRRVLQPRRFGITFESISGMPM